MAAGLVSLAPLLLSVLIPDLAVAATMFIGALLGAAAVWHWQWPIPLRIPWPRAVLVTVALGAVGLNLSAVGRDVDLHGVGRVAAMALVLPGAVGFEVFLRGTFYSALDSARGPTTAVLGSVAPEVVAVGLTAGRPAAILWTLVSGTLFGLSRMTTGSALPAILARAITALVAIILLAIQP